MKVVVNSPKHGKINVLINKKDYLALKQPKLYVHKVSSFLYVRISKTKEYLHRAVLKAPKGYVVDHINRNTLDNRRRNLRITDIQGNLRNQKRPNNKTGVTGVALYKNGYTAQIKVDYKKIHLGCFKTIEQAARARRKAEKKYWNDTTIITKR